MESLLRCPLCAQPLDRQDTRYLCPRGHSFDRAAAGYVHLLPANKLHSKDPGDDKAMAAARNRFLSGGYYDPLRDALTRLALAYAPDRAQILDAGCGEGYYSAALFQALLQAGKHPRMAGVDLSKHALRRAAKRQGSIEFAVASVYDLPVADQQIDLLVNCAGMGISGAMEFTPDADARRLMEVNVRPGGLYYYVVPGARHLWELKQVLYDTPYPNEEKETPYPGLSYQEIQAVDGTIHLPDTQAILDLFQMTPYFWKTPRQGALRLAGLPQLDTTISFRIHVFRKQDRP